MGHPRHSVHEVPIRRNLYLSLPHGKEGVASLPSQTSHDLLRARSDQPWQARHGGAASYRIAVHCIAPPLISQTGLLPGPRTLRHRHSGFLRDRCALVQDRTGAEVGCAPVLAFPAPMNSTLQLPQRPSFVLLSPTTLPSTAPELCALVAALLLLCLSRYMPQPYYISAKHMSYSTAPGPA
jgi:hypothetical protein